MQPSGATSDPRSHHNGDQPLPLFRPEALADQKQKFYGEVVLIRPLPLMALGWLAFAVVAAAFGFLLLGHYTEKARVAGTVLPSRNTAGSSVMTTQAEFYVPPGWAGRLQPGNSLLVRCYFCPSAFAHLTGTVLAVSDAPVISKAVPGHAQQEPMYKVTVSLPPQAAPVVQISDVQARKGIEAEIPLGRKPLINWFFERSGS